MNRILKFLNGECFGNDGTTDCQTTNLVAYEGIYKFEGKKFGVTLWEKNENAAKLHCRHFNMVFGDKIDLN